ncbi:MAG TPA: pilin [Candidatus Saccharimonadales bacterium]|nr:pilin [Candidatus Saccharimonadales bacterium]
MMKLKSLIVGLAIIFGFALVPTPSVHAASPASNFAACGGNFLGFPKWYAHLPGSGSCRPQITSLNQIWVIVLNVVDIVIRLAGIVAIGMIIWGGFKYIKSQGEPGQLSQAKDIIINAIIGLVLVIAAVAIVEFAAGSIK